MATVNDWVTLLKLRNDTLNGINYEDQQQKYVLLLATRITELCLDVVTLLNNNSAASAPIILRTALESYADLVGCIQRTEYPEIMTKSFYWQLHEVLKYQDREKSDYYKERGQYFPVNKRFSSSGLNELFNGYYKALSLHSHGNLSALVEFNTNDEGSILNTVNNDVKLLNYFDQTVHLFALVLKSVFDFFHLNPEGSKYIQEILDEINGISA